MNLSKYATHAFNEGREARRRRDVPSDQPIRYGWTGTPLYAGGDGRAMNPYPELDPEHAAWRDGWLYEDAVQLGVVKENEMPDEKPIDVTVPLGVNSSLHLCMENYHDDRCFRPVVRTPGYTSGLSGDVPTVADANAVLRSVAARVVRALAPTAGLLVFTPSELRAWMEPVRDGILGVVRAKASQWRDEADWHGPEGDGMFSAEYVADEFLETEGKILSLPLPGDEQGG